MIGRSIDKGIVVLIILAVLLSACSLVERNGAPTLEPTIAAPTLVGAPTAVDQPAASDTPAAGDMPAATYTPAAAETAPPADQPAPAGDQTGGQAYINSLRLTVLESLPVQVQAHIAGDLSDGCTQLAGVDVLRDGQTFKLQVNTTRDPQAICIQILAPFETSVDLDTAALAAATYTVTAGDVSESFSLAADNTVQVAPNQVAPDQVTPDQSTAGPAPEAGVNQAVDGLFSRTTIYLIAIGDNGRSGPVVGCEDSAVPVVIDIEPTVAPMTAAIQRLLADKRQYYGQSGLYNVFYQSDLQLEGINLVDGQATIALSGSLILGGVCDNPRVMAQLQQTAQQYSTVDSAVIYLNDQPLEEVLSLR